MLCVNGHFLGYLPVKDWIYAWHSAGFAVPCDFLKEGYNELTVSAGQAAPRSRNAQLNWDEVMFRVIFLERNIH